MRATHFLLAALVAFLTACGSSTDIRDFSLREVKLPSGKDIKAEDLRTPTLMARGAMFRESLPPDRGLLYAYARPGRYSFWMYQTKMPLDTVWMNSAHTVIEVVSKMPPLPFQLGQGMSAFRRQPGCAVCAPVGRR